jgi:putative ABC transport system permease protein
MSLSRFMVRELVRSRKQALVFVCCVVLSILSVAAIDGFGENLRQALLADARVLHAADVLVHAHLPFSPRLIAALHGLEARGEIQAARVYEFYAMARNLSQGSVLAQVKVVQHGYPFYGKVELASGRGFEQVLTPGRVIVEKSLLTRLNISVGDPIRLGKTQLTVADVVIREPDRPVSFFSFGPRIFVAMGDLNALDLVSRRSRVNYDLLVKVRDAGGVDRIAHILSQSATAGQERVDTFQTAPSRIRRFFDNFLFFLDLIGLFTLLLAGIGIQSALTALLRENRETIAIIKALGATGGFVMRRYLAMVAALGAVGTALGLTGGFFLQSRVRDLFADMLPNSVTVTLSARALVSAGLLGLAVVGLFASLPLVRLRDLKPVAIFRRQSASSSGIGGVIGVAAGIFLLFALMVIWQLKDVKTGAYFILGVCTLVAVTTLWVKGLMGALSRVKVKPLVVRQALKGLFRPGNATGSVVVTLSAALAVIMAIFLVEQNLRASFIDSYPADVPNLYFDIQPSQVEAFREKLSMPAQFFPIVRARVAAINGTPIDPKAEQARRGDNMAREFNLTYREHLLKDEIMVAGGSLFSASVPVPVSVLDTVARIRSMALGDRILFKIQGVPLEARITSIRSRAKASLTPFFYFVFPPSVLEAAPQTVFAALRVAPDQIGGIVNRMVAGFANLSVIDVTQTAAILGKLMRRLSRVIETFALLSMIAGLLILVGSVLATRAARIREAVYFKILGARKRFVMAVFTLESLFIGAISAVLAMATAQVGSWVVCTRYLDLTYRGFWTSTLFMGVATTGLVVALGLVASVSILNHKPAIYLREQS